MMIRRSSLVCLVASVAASLASPSAAHDFWIEPSTFRPQLGSIVEVGLRVGEQFAGEPVAYDTDRIESFTCQGPDAPVPIAGWDGREPAGLIRVTTPGRYMISYRSHRSFIELEPRKFEAYLNEEGLESIVTMRRQQGDVEKPAREVYSRCAKALLAAGDSPPVVEDRPLGLTLELVAERDPYLMRAGDELPVRLLYDGKPFQAALVVALNRGHPAEKVAARSDAEGRVTVKLVRSGVWLIKSVHMVPAAAETGAEWESFWASLTFEIADL